MKTLILLNIIVLCSLITFSAEAHKRINFDLLLQEGDLIFQRSQSSQAAAIAEATGSTWSHVGIIVKDRSQWYVVEARQGVEATLLANFIARGKNKEFKVYRNRLFTNSPLKKNLHQVLLKYKGKPYDIYFEFSNQRIYCSELTYRVMQELTGFGVGVVNKIKELRLDGPYVQQLIQRRYTDLGKELNPEEPIITPINQMRDPNLKLVM